MSLRKKISRMLPKIIQTEENKNYIGKTINNYRFNILTNKYNNRSLANPSLNIENNYLSYQDNIKISSKYNFAYNTEKTEYSSQINDCLSKINGSSEIKPISTQIRLNETLSPRPKYKTETHNFFNSSKNIFNSRINIYPKIFHQKNFQTSSCWYARIDDIKNINKFDMESIVKFSNTFTISKTPKPNKRHKIIKNIKMKNTDNRFNSLNCFIDDYIDMDEDKLLNRYYPNYEEYLGKLDYKKLKEKSKNLKTTKEKIKGVFKDTKLLMAMCDYLNTSLSKLKNEKRLKLKLINNELKIHLKNKRKMKSLKNTLKNNLIPKKDIFKMNTKYNNSFIKKAPMIYKNGYYSKSFYFQTSLSPTNKNIN